MEILIALDEYELTSTIRIGNLGELSVEGSRRWEKSSLRLVLGSFSGSSYSGSS